MAWCESKVFPCLCPLCSADLRWAWTHIGEHKHKHEGMILVMQTQNSGAKYVWVKWSIVSVYVVACTLEYCLMGHKNFSVYCSSQMWRSLQRTIVITHIHQKKPSKRNKNKNNPYYKMVARGDNVEMSTLLYVTCSGKIDWEQVARQMFLILYTLYD